MTQDKTTMPRDMAGSMTFEGGTGHIVRGISFGEFMEVYKVDATMKVYSPDHVDPERTNPNAPWSTTHAPEAGCANPIVARMIFQADDATKMLMGGNERREPFMLQMWKIKEALLTCEGIAKPTVEKIDAKCGQIKSMKIKPGAAWNPFPSIEGLTLAAQSFLNQANRVIRLISALPNQFLPLKVLHKNFDKLAVELEGLVPADANLLGYVKQQAHLVRRIADLRNFEEHDSDKGRKTVINDFKLMKDGVGVLVPQWGFDGEDLESIASEMPQIVEFLTALAEGIFYCLLIEYGNTLRLPVFRQRAKPNKECPIMWRLEFNFSSMQPGAAEAAEASGTHTSDSSGGVTS